MLEQMENETDIRVSFFNNIWRFEWNLKCAVEY
jgi:hypothetical protein